MKDIRLLRLELNNFKGIKSLTIIPNGDNMDIFGDNGTGKTTIADAFFWLMFGKDSAGRSDFEIKTLTEDGTPIHFLEHSVLADLQIGGDTVSLEKVMREKWVRQRGSLDREFQGHETEYLINGIPKQKAEYTAFIKTVAEEDVFRLLTNPMYFNGLDTKKKRGMLFDMFGSVTDADVMAKNSAVLGDLQEQMGRNTAEELKTAITAQKRRVNADIQAIPSRIDEASRFIAEVESENEDELNNELASIEAQIKEKETRLRDMDNDTAKAEVRRKMQAEINRLSDELMEQEQDLRDDLLTARNAEAEKRNAISEAESDKFEFEKRVARLHNESDAYRKTVAELETKLSALREEWKTVFESKMSGDSKCKFCGQTLPPEMIADAEKSFNSQKASHLESINKKGEAIKSNISCELGRAEAAEEEIKSIEEKLATLSDALDKLNADYRKAVSETSAIAKKLADFQEEAKSRLSEAKAAMERAGTAAEAEEAENECRNTLKDELCVLVAKKRATAHTIEAAKKNKEIRARIAELEADAKRLSTEYERLERLDYLLGEFSRLKASMLEEKINSRFKYAKFKLFDRQINGGIVETCEVTYNGVPYSVLNNAMKINIGIDIISAFCENYGLLAPIFIDNAESVTRILDTESQQVRLYVSAADKTLRFENK